MDAQIGTGPVKESNRTLPDCYVREAKIYDEGMVARWKVLMDGLLLFAALFSAVVTAFIIEGYKTLSPDPSAMTVLSTITNTTELQISLPDLNGSPTLAIITNVFWFLSLALSLTCALTATLIEQWASDYVRTIERREAPAIKARIRAYLFEGVENSNVAAIVEGTPLLLHASLFSFFIGLIFFLHPISAIITFLAAGILAAFGVAYLSATIAPLIDTASPIRTPLTTLVLQFSSTRNLLRKMSLCGIKVASIVRSQVGAGALVCWRPVKKFSSVVAETEPDAAEMQPRSEIPERSIGIVAKQWLEPVANIWSDNTLRTSNLDTIKESTALDDSLAEFHKREIASLSWTLQHTTNDGEMLPFLEGIPVYLNSWWSDLHFGKPSPSRKKPGHQSPAQVLRAVLQNPESTFLLKLDTFIFTRYESMSQRDASAVVNALSSLFENKIHLYTEATSFLHDFSSSDLFRWFMERAIELHPSLSPTLRRLHVMAVLRCAQARGSKYTTTDEDLLQSWPYYSVLVPVASFRLSELHPFWDAIMSFLGIDRMYGGAVTFPTAATAAEANQGIALLSLCLFFWQAVPDPQGHFTDTFHHVMGDFVSYVSPLAEGSAGAQQAYSAAALVITSALEEASPKLKRGQWCTITVDAVSGLLHPLVRITDDAAATTAQRVLSSRFWPRWAFGNIPSSWLENPKVIQTICARRLIESLGGQYRPRLSSIPKNVTSLAGLHSTTQIELTQHLREWLTDIPPDDLRHIPSLFRLLRTLDEPKAVINVQGALREFLTPPEPERNSDTARADVTETINLDARSTGFLSLLSTKWQPESNLEAAREALRLLEKTASKPEFIYKALSIPDYP
ncbi:hypothetical protein C8J56DRAFT_1032711 [Mycena floridula]|nr:hypothetical protein C8J56DRAFT_1032711 [Mycena floridula]